MNLDEKFIPVRTGFYQTVESLFQKVAGLFGYPENPGMLTVHKFPTEKFERSKFLESLPVHQTYWPPQQRPETWFDMIFGPSPKVDLIPRYVYENQEEGFYNFYIENYRNMYFFPDWVSEFLQVRLNLCLDLTLLETIREVLFVGLLIYSQIVILRITLAWFLSINPYAYPWCYIAAAVDWTEDILQGIVPSVLGVNVTGTVFLGIIGVLGDSLNHLVFTMPFLPSEGEETKLLVNQQVKDVLVFHYLPVLWYRYPIPNEIREFWYKERLDILNYMQTAYQDLDIQFLPDKIIQELNQQKLKANLPQFYDSFIDTDNHFRNHLSTEILSQNDLIRGHEIIPSLNSITEHFHAFWIT